MMKNKANVTLYIILAFVVVIVGFLALAMTGVINLTGVGEKEIEDGVDIPAGANAISKYKLDLFFRARDPSAQDSDADLEYDIFIWDASKIAILKSKGIMDATGITPILFDGTKTVYQLEDTLEKKNLIPLNNYKFLRDSSYNGADEETKIDDYLNVWLGDQAETATPELLTGVTYLVLVTESASTDTWDLIPFAFLMNSVTKTILDPKSFESGDTKITVKYNYYSDALKEGQYAWDGECTDSEGADPTLGSALDNVIASTVGVTTLSEGFDADCEITIEVTKDGYVILMKNPLADGNSEKAHMIIYPYVVGYSNTTLEGGVMQMITDPATSGTGRVKYNGAVNVTTVGNYTLWESLTVSGQTITSSSTTNANVKIAERIYEPNSFSNAYDDNAKVTIPFKLVNIDAVNYSISQCDTSTADQKDCTDEVMGNSDQIFNITLTNIASSLEISKVVTA